MDSVEHVNRHAWVIDNQIAKLLDLPENATIAWLEDHQGWHLSQCFDEGCYRLVGADLLRLHEQITNEVMTGYQPADLVAREKRLELEAEERRKRAKEDRCVWQADMKERKRLGLIAEAKKIIHRMCKEVDLGLFDGTDDVEYVIVDEPDDEMVGRVQEPDIEATELIGTTSRLRPRMRKRLVSSKRWRKDRRKAA